MRRIAAAGRHAADVFVIIGEEEEENKRKKKKKKKNKTLRNTTGELVAREGGARDNEGKLRPR